MHDHINIVNLPGGMQKELVRVQIHTALQYVG